MRIALIVIGIILIIAGIWVLAGNGSYTDTDTVVSVGSAALKASHQEAIPQWAGIAGIVVGAILALVGIFRGKR
jgi:uncharacterized membrane protein YqiK